MTQIMLVETEPCACWQRLFDPAYAVVIATFFACAGCGILTDPDEDQKAAMIATQVIKDVNRCNADNAPGFAQSAVARTNCINQALSLLRPLYPYPDVLDFYLTNRRTTAEKFSSGRITLAKANEEFNEQRLKMISEERRRLPEGNSVANSGTKPRHSTLFDIVFKGPHDCRAGNKSVDCI